MHWLEAYNLILFDFDGLLVNTEHLHFQAYQKMCKSRGFSLPWDFPFYCSIAHASSEGLRLEIYKTFPELQALEPNWAVLYAEKKKAYEELIEEPGIVSLMPGVTELLGFLADKDILSCVVTNSFLSQVKSIKDKLPLLQTIPCWITREDYARAKPAPDPYLCALDKYSKPTNRSIGFEDTLRGWKALHAAGVEGVVISSCLDRDTSQYFAANKVKQMRDFHDLLSYK